MMKTTIDVAISAQSRNDRIAATVREQLRKHNVLALNFISSPGSGKTSLLETMAKSLGHSLAVITGDIQTTLDADRLSAAGATAIQIETGGSCHLTAQQILDELPKIDLSVTRLLVIENVGNLVCPSTYDLGEDFKIALLSVAEGDEKPIKYPALFVRAKAVVVTKTDLLPYVNFSIQRVRDDCFKLNNNITVLPISCRTGEGVDAWLKFVESLRQT